MRLDGTLLLFMTSLAASCLVVEPGAYRCDDDGRCPSGLVCARDRCVAASPDGGQHDHDDDAGAPLDDGGSAPRDDAGEVAAPDGGAPALLVDDLAVGDQDDGIRAIDAVIDDDGTLHVALWTLRSLPVQERVRYARCPAPCDDPTDWTSTLLFTDGVGELDPTLTLRDGQPLLLFTSSYQLRLAACDGDCTTAAAWSIETLLGAPAGARLAHGADLAVGCASAAAGSELTVVRCATASCAAAADWSVTALEVGTCGSVLDATAGAAGIVALHRPLGATGPLRLARCSAGCESASAWSSTTVSVAPVAEGSYRFFGASGGALLDVGGGRLGVCADCAPLAPAMDALPPLLEGARALALTSAGQARLLVVDDDGSYGYAACGESCDGVATQAFLPSDSSRPALLLDDDGLPLVVYARGAELRYARGR